MSRSFLIGNFLPAYGRRFGQVRRPVRTDGALTTERLAVRFDERARRHRERRRSYLQGIQAGLVAALVSLIVVFRFDIAPPENLDLAMSDQEVVVMEEILQTEQRLRPPPPPRPPVPVEVPNDEILDDVALDLDATLDLNEPLADLPPPPPEPSRAVEEAAEPEIFYAVEQMPEMVGGMAALLEDLEYPDLARKAELEGLVVVQVIIPPTGIPQDARIVKSVGKVLDNEAIRAVLQQTFTPGRQRGRPVTVAMNIPVKFRLTAP